MNVEDEYEHESYFGPGPGVRTDVGVLGVRVKGQIKPVEMVSSLLL